MMQRVNRLRSHAYVEAHSPPQSARIATHHRPKVRSTSPHRSIVHFLEARMRTLLTRRSPPTASHTSMRILVYAVLFSGSTPILAASFDCTRALTKVERLIC